MILGGGGFFDLSDRLYNLKIFVRECVFDNNINEGYLFRYLGGKWDPNKLTLQVQSVFPCSLNNPSDQTECTVLQNKIRELITQQVTLTISR